MPPCLPVPGSFSTISAVMPAWGGNTPLLSTSPFAVGIPDADGGAITPEGLYTAPGRAGTYRILATSTEDASVVLVATVTVN